MSNIINTAKKVAEYILKYRRPLLVILTKKKAIFYFDEEEFEEKYEDCWEAEHQIFVTLDNHGLEVESRGNDDLIVMFARIPGEELTLDEQEKRLEWVKRKLTDNGVEWPEDLIRVFIASIITKTTDIKAEAFDTEVEKVIKEAKMLALMKAKQRVLEYIKANTDSFSIEKCAKDLSIEKGEVESLLNELIKEKKVVIKLEEELV
jgi:ribosomal protein L17